MNKKLLSLYSLKFNPFSPEVPTSALWSTASIESFCWRIEQQIGEGGFALAIGDPGTGKSAALRLLLERLGNLGDVMVGVLTRPQAAVADFYRELGHLFSVPLAPHNRWASAKVLREKWLHHIENSLHRPVLLIDEAQQMSASALSELRLLSSAELDSRSILITVLAADNRLASRLQEADLLPIASRIRARLRTEALDPSQLLPVQRASELSIDSAPLTHWLVQGLWSDQAVGILGGEPKCCKSFLALDLAVSVASGAPCLRQFPVRHSGPVLLFPAEDSLAVVRRRLEGICSAAGVGFQSLPVEVITAPTLRLDTPKDRERLSNTVQAHQPRLLILDPLIRLHRLDENDATQIAALLSYLRQLQRAFHLAVLLVHHARKDANATRPGQALRGSSELHGWADSNLYMRRRGAQLTLSTEHRAAASENHIPLQLTQTGSALALSVASDSSIAEADSEPSALQRVQQILAGLDQPVTVQQLRKLCGLRTATVCSCLAQLIDSGMVSRDSKGYQLKLALQSPALSVSAPIDSQGSGNGKHSP